MKFLFIVQPTGNPAFGREDRYLDSWLAPLSAGATLRDQTGSEFHLYSPAELPPTFKESKFRPDTVVFFQPDLPGDEFGPLTKRLRQEFPGALLLAAGPSLPGRALDVLKTFSALDGIASGLLDGSLVSLARGLRPENITGLILRHGDKHVAVPTSGEETLPFDSLSGPLWMALHEEVLEYIPIEAMRRGGEGCSVCQGPTPAKMFWHSPDWIEKEVERLGKKRGLRGIRLLFDPTQTPPGWRESVEEALRPSRDFLEFTWASPNGGAVQPLFAPRKRTSGESEAPKSETKGPSVIWSSPLFDPSGYAEDARNLILSADRGGIPLRLNELRWSQKEIQLDPKADKRLRELLSSPVSGPVTAVWQCFPPQFSRAQGAKKNVGRTMFETEQIPEVWAAKCNEMDEIWVPASFNVESFARSGVDLEKLRVLPGAIDADLYCRPAPPLPFREGLGFVFLSSFDWQHRKGWDLLLTAFCREFQASEDVTLVLKVYSSFGHSTADLEAKARDFVKNNLGLDPDRAPRIIFVDEFIPSDAIPRLYRSADVFVLPTRGEGWGRPFMEAMASGLPVIGTRFGGHLDYMHEGNSLLLDCAVVPVSEEAIAEVPVYRGHRWAEPIVEHLRELMRKSFTDRQDMRKLGERARAEILSTYNLDKVGDWIGSLVRGEEQGAPPAPDFQSPRAQEEEKLRAEVVETQPERESPIRVQWEGAWFVNHSLAKVNRELVSQLLPKPSLELSLLPFEKDQFDPQENPGRYGKLANRMSAPLSGPVDCHISHRWPPRFEAPGEGHWIWIQPWEFGSLPAQWARTVREKVDEIWVPSHYVRRLYIEAGVPPSRVTVVPNGVDAAVFHPEAKPYNLPTTKKFKFLFVGGTIWRKGIDILMTAYNTAFNDRDDVCLVIKDMGADSFYRGRNARELIQRIQDTPGSPEIIYLDQRLTEEEMAGLYTACDCLVHPYRGEGFGMPVAEAMASGLPVVVTRGGACDDFCDEDNAWFIPARKRPLSSSEMETVGIPWVLEPDPTALARRFREILTDAEGRTARGQCGRKKIQDSYSWESVAVKAEERLHVVTSRPILRESGEAHPGMKSITFLHCEKEIAPPGTKAELIKVDPGKASSLGAAFSVALANVHSDWIGLASPGFRPEEGWLKQLEERTSEGGVAVLQQEAGSLIFFPRLAAGSLTFESHFQSWAVLLEFARKLQFQGLPQVDLDGFPATFSHAGEIPDGAKAEVDAVQSLERAVAAMEKDDLPGALDLLRQALEKKPDYEAALFSIGEILLALGEKQGAMETASRLHQVAPENAEGLHLMGRCYFNLGDLEKAEDFVDRSLQIDPESARAHSDLAVILWRKGDSKEALKRLQAALTLNPDDLDALYNSARILEEVGRKEEAITFLERYLTSRPDDEEVRQRIEQLRKGQA